MRKVCRNFGLICVCRQTLDCVAALLAWLLPEGRLCQLFDVVHHAVQVPWCVDLGAPPVIQTGQAFAGRPWAVVSNVSKHRLHGADTLAVELSAPGRVNGLAHAFTGVVQVLGPGFKARDLSPASVLEFERTFAALAA